MVKSIYVPEAGGVVNFPDDTSPQTMRAYIDAKYPRAAAPAGAPTETPDESGILGRFAYGFGTGLSDVPGGIAALLYPAEEAAKTSAGQFSEQSRKYLQETFGIDPTKDPTTAQMLAETLGGAVSFLVPGGAVAKGAALAGKGAALAGRSAALAGRAGAATAGAQGVALGAASRAQTIEQQLASGMEISPEQQIAAQRLSGLFGASQALPMQKFFGPINTILSKVPASKAGIVEQIIKSRLAKVTKAGVQEAAQEVAEGIANDLMEYGVYNPDVQIGQDILSNAGGGAFAGSVIEGIIQLAAGRKLRGARQLQADLKAEQAQNLADLNQASVAQAAEQLRATGIEGELDIEPNEDIDGNIRYTITSPTGKPLVDAMSENEATAAIDMYKAKTGANVSLKVRQAPKLNMIRIGNERFPSIEAADEKRQSLRKYVRDLDSYFSNIELVSKHAAEKKQPPEVYAKQIDDTLRSARNRLAQFDAYFEAAAPAPSQPGPTIPTAPAQPVSVAAEAAPAPAAPVATAPVEAAPEVTTAPVEPIGRIADIETPEAPAEGIEAIADYEPITEEAQAPEMPIGAVELPVEESRVLPDTIVESEAMPQEVDIEPAATQTVQRPSATPAQLDALKMELFGKPLGYQEMTPEQLQTYEAERDKRYPPVDTEAYLAAGPTGESAPRNLREATINNPVARNYTPETQEWMKKVYAGVQARLDAIVPEAAKAELKTLIPSPVGTLARGLESGVETQYGIKSIVDLSIGILRPGMSVEAAVNQLVEIVNHEIIHVLTRKGVLRPAEWRMLSRAAANTKVPGKKYTYLDKAEAIYTPNGNPISPEYADPEAVVEEAVAEMYRDWVKKGTGQKNINGLFNRITEFFRRIFQALRGAGYDDVFKRIESGEIGRREGVATVVTQGSPSVTASTLPAAQDGEVGSPTKEDGGEVTAELIGPKLSAAPLPQYMAQQNESLFAKAPKVSFRDTMFGYFFGQRPIGKTLNTLNYGDIELSSTKMAAIAGRSAVVESGAYMRELESLLNQKQTGNFQRMDADASATAALAWRRRSGHLTASMMMRGKLTLNFQTPGDIMSATMKVENDPDSLKEIFKVLNEEGPINPVTGERETKATIFRSYAVAKRGEWLRSTGQNVPRELTPQYIRESIATAQQYPEVIEAYNKYQRFNKNLLTTARDAGLISQAELGRLTNQMNYYGFIYEVYGEPLGPTSAQKTASRFKLRAYTGSARGGLVNDPMFVMIQNAQFWVDSIAKNLAAMKSFDVARQMGEARLLGTGEDPDEAAGEAPDVMFFSQNGVVKRFAVKDPLLVIALGSDDRVTVGKFWEALGLPAHILRESVTRDPGFMARNLLRDTVSSWITSGVDFTPVIGTVKGFATALKDGASFQDLASRGVVGSYDLALMSPEDISATFKRNAMPINVKMATSVEGLSAAGISLWNRLGNVSEASDAATRIAVYDALIAQGKSEAEAAMQAIELLDFTRRGASQTLSILTKLIPFLNARIQGMDVLYQAGRSGIRYATGRSLGERDANVGKQFLVRGAMLAAIAVALEAMNDGDEDYEQLDEYIKNGNFIIPLKYFGLPGKFIAVPKPFEAGTLFATIPQQMYKTTTGQSSTRQNAQLFWDQFSSTFGVNPIPQFLLPSIEIITNHNFYTGLPLISEGKSRLSPELQYNTSTSQLAMMIGGLPIFYDFTTGKFGGMSPIVVDKLISGYGGPIGTYMVEAVSLGMESAAVGPDRMPRELTRLPVVKSFFIDAKSKNPKVVTQAYELFQIADEVNRTVSRMKQMRDVEALTAYVEENKDVLTYKKYIFKLAENLNKLSAQERSIERDSTMTREEKLAAQRRLRETRIQLASKVDEINRKLGR